MNNEQPIVKEIHLIDYIYVLIKWRTFILRSVLAVFAVSCVAYFLIVPRWYLAEATITPAKQKSSFNPSSMLKDALPFSGLGGVFKSSDELDLYITVLKSRNSLTRVISKFDLQKLYDLDNIEETLKELQDNVSFTINNEENALTISVFDTDSVRAADMANYFIAVLNEVYIGLSVSEARNNLKFIEARYAENLQRLKESEDSLSMFQKKFGIFNPSEQIKSAIQAAATIQSQIMLKEVELGVLRKNLGPENQTVKDIVSEISQLHVALKQMQYGSSSADNYFKIFPLFERMPQLGKEYLRLLREVELQTKLQAVLLPMVEQAKIEEQKNVPVVIVLDQAVPPVKAKKPRRILMVLLFTSLALILSMAASFIIDAMGRLGGSMQTNTDVRWEFVRSRFSLKSFFRLKGTLKDE